MARKGSPSLKCSICSNVWKCFRSAVFEVSWMKSITSTFRKIVHKLFACYRFIFCIILKCITSVWMSHCHRNLPYLNNCLKSVLVHVNLPLKWLTTKSQSSLFSISVHGCLIASQNLNFCFFSFEIPGESKYSRMFQNERFHRSNKNMPALSLFFSSQFLFSFSFTLLDSDVLDDS